MRQAIKAKAVRTTEAEAKVSRRRDQVTARSVFSGRVFESLDKDEKEALLKLVAIRLRLIEPS